MNHYSITIIGSKGHILFACSGWYSEENVVLLERELTNILDIGEDAYLSSLGVAFGK